MDAFSLKATARLTGGVGSADACASPTNLAERYILRLSSKSEAEVRFLCDESVTINGHKGFHANGKLKGHEIVRVLTEESELFEFSVVSEGDR